MHRDIASLPPAFDPVMAADAIDEVLNGAAASLPENRMERARALVAALAGNSPYLARALKVHADLLPGLIADGPDLPVRREMEALAKEAPQAASVEALMRRLRLAKGRLALLIAAADIAGDWSLARVTKALSDFADLALGLALSRLLRERVEAGDLADENGVFILGMGKLGAHELNYSSDIDLIILYDEEIVRYQGRKSLAECMTRLARDLVRIMEARTAEGYVFRTDLRLRPDPGATAPALPVGAAETYYQSVALSWERAAMIKARPVAGDAEAGRNFLERLSPFVWRRSLDYAAIADIHAIKARIHSHHGHRGIDLPGQDIKLGPGGIREIEFFAQILQLVHGGRERGLRVRDTLGALDRLVAGGRIAAAVRDDLADSYIFLRTLEHRLQMVDDAQTHCLPEGDAGLRRIANFCGLDGREALAAVLRRHLERTRRHYADLLPEREDGEERLEGAALAGRLESLGYKDVESAAAIVERWRLGRYRALRTARARGLLEATLPALLEAFSATAEPDQGFARFDKFLSQVPAGIQLFALFQANPSLFRLVARILGMAPALAEHLARRAQLLDGILDPDFFAPLPGREALADDFGAAMARARNYEETLDIARRWTDDLRFRIGVQTLEAIADAREAGEALCDLADVVIERLLEAVDEDYARRHGRFPGGALAVVAMGKFGGRELSPGSDLDLVLLYEVEGEATQSAGAKPLAPSRYFSGLGQAFLTAVTARTAEGRLWEVDTRLRPSGNAGPLVVTLATFADYYSGTAWTWEHMALTRARVVAAPRWLADRLRKTISGTLTRGHDPDALRPAVADMRQRLRKQFGSDNLWNIKHVAGGFVDLEFAVQYLLLREGAKHPEIFAPRLDDCIDRLVAVGALDEVTGAQMKRGHALLHAVQAMLRLTLDGPSDETTFSPDLRAALARAAGEPDFAAARNKLLEVEADLAAICRDIVDPEP